MIQGDFAELDDVGFGMGDDAGSRCGHNLVVLRAQRLQGCRSDRPLQGGNTVLAQGGDDALDICEALADHAREDRLDGTIKYGSGHHEQDPCSVVSLDQDIPNSPLGKASHLREIKRKIG